ncbi:MAG: sugar phosphate isomerase/epimerase family protein [Thermoguttaceae bacterium]
MDRRAFLKSGIVTATVVAGAGLSVGSLQRIALAAEKKRVPVALQIYSVRGAAEKDLAAVLKKVSEIGFDGVEFAGYYGHDPKEVRKMLDDCGLKAEGTHTGIGEFRNNFDKQVDIHKTLGAKFMIVPGGIDRELHDVEASAKIAEEFSRFAEKAKAAGLGFGYHAHGGDAKVIDGMSAWARLMSKASKDVVGQMDVGNFLGGGGDPYAELAKFPGQAGTVHLKEHGNNDAPVGDGVVDWKKVFEICETAGGTEWYVVEYESKPNSFDGVVTSFDNLKKMKKTK